MQIKELMLENAVCVDGHLFSCVFVFVAGD